MWWTLRELVLGIHVFLGIVWVGGVLFVGWGVFPAVRAMDYRNQQRFLLSLMRWTHKVFTLSGAGVIVTGIFLGTVFGPIQSMGTASLSPYGHHFVLALVVGSLTLAWGTLVSYPHAISVLSKTVLWNMADEGYDTFLKQSLRGVTLVSGVEVIGFVGLLTIMLTF
ncbi:hypothetical protein [Indiicoccus explosivorum]|uniref:hypothetical protein n=1 Tax=Indiicoccus explosivorum TaxID=1917864 RepID=UPI000B43CEE0|nr:hypothetical protein [Indiicoccus explosivorum]